jgi:hypothetical protein
VSSFKSVGQLFCGPYVASTVIASTVMRELLHMMFANYNGVVQIEWVQPKRHVFATMGLDDLWTTRKGRCPDLRGLSPKKGPKGDAGCLRF